MNTTKKQPHPRAAGSRGKARLTDAKGASKTQTARPAYPGVLRVIGGIWRRRRLAVPDAEGLRPTPDRVRETLFNWLQPSLPGARCIDLFAGTGALCLEALSRGAGQVVMVEKASHVVAVLRENVARLGAENAEVIEADAIDYLGRPPQVFDIVFIDPPFHSDLIARSSRLLDERGWIRAGALIYIEAPRDATVLPIPGTWELVRSRTAGQVGYHLARKQR